MSFAFSTQTKGDADILLFHPFPGGHLISMTLQVGYRTGLQDNITLRQPAGTSLLTTVCQEGLERTAGFWQETKMWSFVIFIYLLSLKSNKIARIKKCNKHEQTSKPVKNTGDFIFVH